jgi:hypothetical protein
MERLQTAIINAIGAYPAYLLLGSDEGIKLSKRPNFQHLFHRCISVEDLINQIEYIRANLTFKQEKIKEYCDSVDAILTAYFDEFSIRGDEFILSLMLKAQRIHYTDFLVTQSRPTLEVIIESFKVTLEKHFPHEAVSLYFSNNESYMTSTSGKTKSNTQKIFSRYGVVFDFFSMESLLREYLLTPMFGARSKASMHPFLVNAVYNIRSKFMASKFRLNENDFRKALSEHLEIEDTQSDTNKLNMLLKIMGVKKTTVPDLSIEYFQLYTGEKNNTIDNNNFNKVITILIHNFSKHPNTYFKMHQLVQLVFQNKIIIDNPDEYIKDCINFVHVVDHSVVVGFRLSPELNLTGAEQSKEQNMQTDNLHAIDVAAHKQQLLAGQDNNDPEYHQSSNNKKRYLKVGGPIVRSMIKFFELTRKPATDWDVYTYVCTENRVSITTIRVYLKQHTSFIETSSNTYFLSGSISLKYENESRSSSATTQNKKQADSQQTTTTEYVSFSEEETYRAINELIRLLNNREHFCAVLDHLIEELCTTNDFARKLIIRAANNEDFFFHTVDSSGQVIIHLQEKQRQYVQYFV